jgi:hypothetical protein
MGITSLSAAPMHNSTTFLAISQVIGAPKGGAGGGLGISFSFRGTRLSMTTAI